MRLNDADGAILQCFIAQREETPWVRGRRICPNAVPGKDRRHRNTRELQREWVRGQDIGNKTWPRHR